MSVHIVYKQNGVKMMRPVLTREEYMKLRNGGFQQDNVARIRQGDEAVKTSLVQMNYSCLPNDDGTLKGSKRMSTTVGMDIDHIAPDEMASVKQRILSKQGELGLLMLEESARGKGYHLVFRRQAALSQEQNLKWASDLLGVEYDTGAKDITRVFFTTTEAQLLFLDDEVFRVEGGGGTGISGNSGNSGISGMSGKSGISGGTRQYPAEYHGIPFAEIIAKYWQVNNNGYEPTEGDRDTLTYQLACDLRHICGRNFEWLDQVIPCYDGFPLEQKREKIRNALASEFNGFPVRLRNTLNVFNGNVNANLNLNLNLNANPNPNLNLNDNLSLDGGDGDASLSAFHFQPKNLPIGLRESLVGVPESMHMPVLCGVLPIAAAYADQVETTYCDGNVHHLGLMSIIRGEQASNKSVVKNAVDVWKRQFDDEDMLARQREEAWKERKKGRKANEKAPEDPKVLIRVVPVTVSCSTLLKRFKNAQGHTIYSFGEELDTLRKTNGAGSWSSKYDIYRLSFDRGEWGQDYNSDAAESGVVRVAYNWTMLGTNGAMRKCFRQDNIENGLSSRILVAEMPDASFAKMPKFRKRSADDEASIQEAVTRLRACSGLIDVPRLRNVIAAWVEDKRVEAAKDIDHVKDVYRKRAAVIGFRCGVIFHLLTGKDRETKPCLDFAVMMADYCLDQQIKTFGEALRNEYVKAQDEGQRYTVNHSVFDQLPPTFTMEDLRAMKQGFCGESALRNIISRWYRDGWIEKTDAKHWTKCHSATLSQ